MFPDWSPVIFLIVPDWSLILTKSNTRFSSVMSIPNVPAESLALNVKKLEVLDTVDGFHLESILMIFHQTPKEK